MLAGLSFKVLSLTMLFMAKAMATLFEYHIQDVFQDYVFSMDDRIMGRDCEPKRSDKITVTWWQSQNNLSSAGEMEVCFTDDWKCSLSTMRNRTDIIENDERNIFLSRSRTQMCLYIQLNLPFVTPAEKEFCELSLGATWNFCIMVPIQIAYSVPSTVNITLNTWAKIPLSSGTRLVPLRYKKIEYIDHPVSFGGEYLTVASRINEKEVPNVFFPLHCGSKNIS